MQFNELLGLINQKRNEGLNIDEICHYLESENVTHNGKALWDKKVMAKFLEMEIQHVANKSKEEDISGEVYEPVKDLMGL